MEIYVNEANRVGEGKNVIWLTQQAMRPLKVLVNVPVFKLIEQTGHLYVLIIGCSHTCLLAKAPTCILFGTAFFYMLNSWYLWCRVGFWEDDYNEVSSFY